MSVWQENSDVAVADVVMLEFHVESGSLAIEVVGLWGGESYIVVPLQPG